MGQYWGAVNVYPPGVTTMTTTSRLQMLGNYNCYSGYYPIAPWINPLMVEALQENNYDAVISPNAWELISRNPTTHAIDEDFIAASHRATEVLIDAGINVWMDLTTIPYSSTDFYNPPIGNLPTQYQAHVADGEDKYESLYGDQLDWWQSLPQFKGYGYECMEDNGAAWLRERTSLEIMIHIFGSDPRWDWIVGSWIPNGNPAAYTRNVDGSETLKWSAVDTRMSQVDAVSFQFFDAYQLYRPTITSVMNYIFENYPSKSFGCMMGYQPSPNQVIWCNNMWWSDLCWGDGNPPNYAPAPEFWNISEQKRRCSIICNMYKARLSKKACDWIAPYIDPLYELPGSGYDYVGEYMAFFSSLQLTTPFGGAQKNTTATAQNMNLEATVPMRWDLRADLT